LFSLGVPPIAVTDYCLHPADGIRSLPRVGGQKDPDLDQLLALGPELVIVAKEENLKRDVEKLEAAGVSVLVTDVCTVEDALDLPETIGRAVGAASRAILALAREMGEGVERARARVKKRLTGICYVWRDPWIACGVDTYASSVLAACGVDNRVTRRRYPKLPLAQARAADLIVLPSEPYPFTERDRAEIGSPPAVLVDGTILCWYGPRTARIAELVDVLG
jgi:ABC-type Fe3+-hydroxamate transport system substrate-binding protein